MMNRRTILLGAGAFALIVAGPALAQKKSAWDGTWTGTTERGGSVQIVISGNQVVQYVFRGKEGTINGSKVSGNSAVFTVGQLNGQVTLQRKGNSATYTYSDSQGGDAKATLTRN